MADVNADGKLDLVVTNDHGAQNNGSVSVLLRQRRRHVPDGTILRLAPTVLQAAVADFNGDGKPDLVVACESTAGREYFAGQRGRHVPDRHLHRRSCAPEVGRDGRPEWGWQAGPGRHHFNGGVQVVLGNGNGTFQPPVTYTPAGAGQMFAPEVADLQRRRQPRRRPAWTGRTGRCTSCAATAMARSRRRRSYAVGAGGEDMALGDFNADGVPDVATANTDAATRLRAPGRERGGRAQRHQRQRRPRRAGQRRQRHTDLGQLHRHQRRRHRLRPAARRAASSSPARCRATPSAARLRRAATSSAATPATASTSSAAAPPAT